MSEGYEYALWFGMPVLESHDTFATASCGATRIEKSHSEQNAAQRLRPTAQKRRIISWKAASAPGEEPFCGRGQYKLSQC